jgi:hypothetical protein
VLSKVLANPEEHNKKMYAPDALEHTSSTAVLPISKGCKFFDSDGEKIFQDKLSNAFSVPENDPFTLKFYVSTLI